VAVKASVNHETKKKPLSGMLIILLLQSLIKGGSTVIRVNGKPAAEPVTA